METFSLQQMEVFPGNPERNLARILRGIRSARDSGASVAVFPELAVPGYLLGDEWENDAFVRECADMNGEILAATRGIAAIWGNVLVDSGSVGEDGRMRKYNAAFVAQDGKWVGNGVFSGHTVKALMPKYREFDDERHFFSLPKLAFERGVSPESLLEPFEILVEGVRRKVGVVICEDMWDDDYSFAPVRILKSKGAQEIVNLSASPYGLGKSAKRDRLLARHSEGVRFHYVNNVGIQNGGKTVFLFDGGTASYSNGRKIASAPSFRDAVAVGTGSETVRDNAETDSEIADVADGLIAGIRAFMASIGRPDGKIVVGISGGVDSAAVAALCVLAVGKGNVVGVNMPSRFNSETTRNLAAELAANLGIRTYEIPIEASVSATKAQLESVLGMPMDEEGRTLNFENVQARDRGSRVLAAVASMLGAVFTNNGNKTETALGYATLYGDVNGAFAPIADLYKTQVYELVRHLNARFGPLVPQGILDLVPSAELSDEQDVDQGKGDPFDYPRTDAVLKRFVEWRRDPEDLLRAFLDGTLSDELGLGRPVLPQSAPYSDAARLPSENPRPLPLFPDAASFVAEIERLWKSYKLGCFKRIQAPPVLAVSKRAFGFDLRESQNGVHFTRNYRALKERVLGGAFPSCGAP